MSVSSPFAALFIAVQDRLKEKTSCRYIDQDLGQLENYQTRPPVSWPCCLIDIEDFTFSEKGGNGIQLCEGFLQIRLANVQYSPANNLAPQAIRGAALRYYEEEQEICNALHAWKPEGFDKLLRRATKNEQRNDDIRVRVIRFAISFEDTTGAPARTRISTPNPRTLS